MLTSETGLFCEKAKSMDYKFPVNTMSHDLEYPEEREVLFDVEIYQQRDEHIKTIRLILFYFASHPPLLTLTQLL